MTADLYLACARVYWSNYDGLPAEMVEHHAQVTAQHRPFIAAIDEAVALSQRVGCDIYGSDRLVPTKPDPFREVIEPVGRYAHLSVTP